jgi:hypothetical protein
MSYSRIVVGLLLLPATMKRLTGGAIRIIGLMACFCGVLRMAAPAVCAPPSCNGTTAATILQGGEIAAVRVDRNYQPYANGRYWLVFNWRDGLGAVPPNQRLRFGGEDFLRFRQDGNTGPSAVTMADPTVFSAVYDDPATPEVETDRWYYITGTNDRAEIMSSNFLIFRTKDFITIELHMLAFDEFGFGGSGQTGIIIPNGPGEADDERAITIGSKTYKSLWGPQLFLDQVPAATPPDAEEAGPMVHLVFAGLELPCGEPYRTVFQCRMRLSDFQSWHGNTSANYAALRGVDGPRFDDARTTLPNPHRRFELTRQPNYVRYDDGGYIYNVGGTRLPVPCTVNCDDLGPSAGQVAHICPGNANECNTPTGCVTHIGVPAASNATAFSGMSAMIGAPYVFFDEISMMRPPTSNHTWDRSILYTWGACNGDNAQGACIAAGALHPGSYTVRGGFAALPLAFVRNTNNRLTSSTGLQFDNGLGFGAGTSLTKGIAESPSAMRRVLAPMSSAIVGFACCAGNGECTFVESECPPGTVPMEGVACTSKGLCPPMPGVACCDANGSCAIAQGSCPPERPFLAAGGACTPEGKCPNDYFVMHSRNAWGSSYYQIVYRRGPGPIAAAFNGMSLTNWQDANVSERVLLRSANFSTLPPVDCPEYSTDPSCQCNRRTSPGGGIDPRTTDYRSFGSSDVFRILDHWSSPPRYIYYITFHAKIDCGEQRTTFFKELSFDSNGDILQLTDPDVPTVANAKSDAFRFLVPASGACCGLDYSGDQLISLQDQFDFLALYFAGDLRADYAQDGSISTQDLFSFLAAFFACR